MNQMRAGSALHKGGSAAETKLSQYVFLSKYAWLQFCVPLAWRAEPQHVFLIFRERRAAKRLRLLNRDLYRR
jgi:hypothetical protein